MYAHITCACAQTETRIKTDGLQDSCDGLILRYVDGEFSKDIFHLNGVNEWSLFLQLISIERLVFDVMGQMWGPALVEEMTCICILLALLGACTRKKVAIAVVSCVQNQLTLGIKRISVAMVGLLIWSKCTEWVHGLFFPPRCVFSNSAWGIVPFNALRCSSTRT